MDNQEKLAVVTSGGGMRCAYSVGTWEAFVHSRRFARFPKLQKPDIVIAISGSVGTAAYKISEQYGSFRNVWEKLLTTGRFINLKRRSMVMDIDYLIQNVFQEMDPLHVDRILGSEADFIIAVTNRKTGCPEFFRAQDCVDSREFFDLMKASMSPPIVYGKYTNFRGNEYFDGGASIGVDECVQEAYRRGATKIIAIDHSLDNMLVRTVVGAYKVVKGVPSVGGQWRKDPRVLLIKPKNIPAGFLSYSEDKIRVTINIGYDDAINHPDIEKFLTDKLS